MPWQSQHSGTGSQATGDATRAVPLDRWDADAHAGPAAAAVRFGGFVHEWSRFDAAAFGVSPAEALYMDPQQRVLLEVSLQVVFSSSSDRRIVITVNIFTALIPCRRLASRVAGCAHTGVCRCRWRAIDGCGGWHRSHRRPSGAACAAWRRELCWHWSCAECGRRAVVLCVRSEGACTAT